MTNIYKPICIIAIMLLMSSAGFCSSGDDNTDDISQWQDLGEGEYLTQDGKIVETQDIGEGQYMTDSEDYLQQEDPDSNVLVTSDEKMVQVDE